MNDVDAPLVFASQSYMDWLNSRIKPDGWTASRKITIHEFHKSKTFMDYLHGDVKNEEAWFACRYEYARESWEMWEAVKVRDEAKSAGKLKCERDFQWVLYQPEVESWIRVNLLAQRFLMCESFPCKDWNELSEPERKKIMFHARRKVEPLPLQILHYGHYPKEEFPEFNDLAVRTEPVVEDHDPQNGKFAQPVKITEAMVQKSGAVYHCLFDVDFSESKNLLHDRFVAWLKQDVIEKLWQGYKKQITKKTKKPLRAKKDLRWEGTRAAYWCLFEVDLSANKGDITAQFDKWLASREIKARLKRYKQEKRGTSDKWKDRLKDLAAWRLYREITKEPKAWIWANEYACKHRKNNRQFHNAKAQRQNGKVIPANQARLFGDPSEASDAVRNALNLLADWIPSEFKKSAIDELVERILTECETVPSG